ncbi:MAG TPA: TlpA disulfide reductase family protein [Acidimicrobiales bacterium]|nr:TlpA disulfide reductase family protein [Acidimicrobiales bacterium]
MARAGARRHRALVAAGILVGVGGLATAGALAAWRASPPAAVAVSPAASATLRLGARAPLDFVLPRLGGGRPLRVRSLLAGHPAVVNVFASWCPACAAELGAFARAFRAADGRVRFLGVDTNDSTPGRALSLLRAAGARYPVVRDSASLAFARAYGVADLPVTFFLDARGRVVDEVLGREGTAGLERQVAALEHGRPTR